MHRSRFTLFFSLLLLHSCSSQKPTQLIQSNFKSFIEKQDSHDGVLVEFYANWCPTCQHFQPDYEKIARYFNAEPHVQPRIAVARVDCATEHPLCSKFKIARYPTLKYGLPSAFEEDAEVQLQEFTGQRQPQDIVHWLGQQKGVQYNYNSSQEAQQERSSSSVALVTTESGVPLTVVKEVETQDLEKATILAFRYVLESPELLKGEQSRKTFLNFTSVIALAHPLQRCRSGAGELLSRLPQLWPEHKLDGPDTAIRALQICDAEADQKDWKACKGSKESKRGYTCGLWMLLHTLAGRVEPEATGGAVWLNAIKGYVKHFFQCTDCAEHFTEMASETAAQNVATRKEAVLWGWRAHNEVNRRLEAIEKNSGDGDPAFPKIQWPPSEMCPLCRLPSLKKKADVTWNEEEVFRFLLKFYHGIPEPQWVTQKLRQSTQLLGMGSRKSLDASGGSSGTAPSRMIVLIVVVALVVFGFIARQRNQRSRKNSAL